MMPVGSRMSPIGTQARRAPPSQEGLLSIDFGSYEAQAPISSLSDRAEVGHSRCRNHRRNAFPPTRRRSGSAAGRKKYWRGKARGVFPHIVIKKDQSGGPALTLKKKP